MVHSGEARSRTLAQRALASGGWWSVGPASIGGGAGKRGIEYSTAAEPVATVA